MMRGCRRKARLKRIRRIRAIRDEILQAGSRTVFRRVVNKHTIAFKQIKTPVFACTVRVYFHRPPRGPSTVLGHGRDVTDALRDATKSWYRYKRREIQGF